MADGTATSVALDLSVEREPSPSEPEEIRGGIEIVLEGERLVRYAGAETEDPPRFGDFVALELHRILEALVSASTGETAVYEVQTVSTLGTPQRLAIERLSDGYLRVALRHEPPSYQDPAVSPHPRSERGYLVSLEAFAAECVQCADELLAATEQFDLASGGSLLEDIADATERLRGSLSDQ